MLNQNEQTLLDRLFGDDWKFRIFRSVAGFSPEDQIKSLGAYLRELVTKPREVLVGSPIASASTIHPTAAVDRVSGAVNISTISLSEAVPTAPAGRVWTVHCGVPIIAGPRPSAITCEAEADEPDAGSGAPPAP